MKINSGINSYRIFFISESILNSWFLYSVLTISESILNNGIYLIVFWLVLVVFDLFGKHIEQQNH